MCDGMNANVVYINVSLSLSLSFSLSVFLLCIRVSVFTTCVYSSSYRQPSSKDSCSRGGIVNSRLVVVA